MFEPKEIKALLKEANEQVAAMILLGINCGFGNNDVAHLPLSAVDLKAGWVTFPRPKTGIARRISLWPETVKALQKAIAKRPEPKDEAHKHLVFVTKYGLTWGKQTSDNPISKEIAKLLKSLKLNRPGLNFYALRHTFETIGGETRDQVAVDAIMGHAREDMATVYRERVSDERLKAVTDFVRVWLFGKAKRKAK
jgi:integrase